MKGLFRYMSIKRLLHIVFLKVANMSLLRGEYRWRFVKLGGVNVKGRCWIYKDVYFDSVAPELITICETERLKLKKMHLLDVM